MLFPWDLKLIEDLEFTTPKLILDSLFVTIQWEPHLANTPKIRTSTVMQTLCVVPNVSYMYLYKTTPEIKTPL